MKKFLLSLCALVACVALAFADVDLPKANRIPNQQPGRCVWASAECLGLSLGYTQVKGLTAANARRATSLDAFSTIRKLGVPVECSQQLSRVIDWKANGRTGTCYSTSRIEEILGEGHACCVGVWIHDNGKPDKHMVVILNMDRKNETVRIWDSNRPDVIQTKELAWFLHNFDGWVMEIPPKK
jgi:hypothetical protein